MEVDNSTNDMSSPSSPAATSKDDDDNRPPPTPSPDRVKCAICLGDLVNKSYSNTCIHQFCFGCLLEWSKVKAECPLCKSQFRSIYHNIRSNSDYDEYVVPPTVSLPIPSFSIRISGVGGGRSPEMYISRALENYGSVPFAYQNYQTHVRAMREHFRDNRIRNAFRYHSGRSDLGGSAIDVMLTSSASSSSVLNENPFHSESPEFFGGALDLVNRPHVHEPMLQPSASSGDVPPRFYNYQIRRRRYDRNQWVRPFDSTLVPGTVFFPSVEYFQRHPSTMRRISPWLHRELTVLMTIRSTRTQMAFAYDLVVSILLRYDIRSNEFRDLLRPYLGAKTRQFQHEFYYFVLSGMRLEEYDRTAQYTPAQSSSTATSSRSNRDPRLNNESPILVTLGDSDDEGGQEQQTNRRRRRSTRNMGPTEIVIDDDSTSPDNHNSGINRNGGQRRLTDYYNQEALRSFGENPVLHPTRTRTTPRLVDFDSQDIENALNAIDNEVSRLRNDGTGSDPEMPVLEPQVDLNNLSSTSATAYVTPNRERLVSISRAEMEDAVEREFNRYMRERDSGSSSAVNYDPEDGRRSPYPRSPRIAHSPPPSLDNSTRENRPLTSADFPILTLRDQIEQRRREKARLLQHQHPDLSNLQFPGPYAAGVGAFVPYPINPPTPTPPLLTAMTSNARIYSSSRPRSSNSLQIRIFPPEASSSSMGLNLVNRPSERSSAAVTRSPSPVDVEDCEFLGVHPIIKKPPLAVITLSSSDSEEEDVNSQISPIRPMRIENSSETFNNTGESSMSMAGPSSASVSTIIPPPRKRFYLPPSPEDQFQAALSQTEDSDLKQRENKREKSSRKRSSSSKSRKGSEYKLHKKKTEKKSELRSVIPTRKSNKKSSSSAVAKVKPLSMEDFSDSAESLMSLDSDIDLNVSIFSTDDEFPPTRKKSYKKKSKKSDKKRIKKKETKSELPKKQRSAKSSDEPSTSTNLTRAEPKRVKSIIVKVSRDKNSQKKIFQSNLRIASSESSESSDEEYPPKSLSSRKSSIPKPKLRSVIGNVSGSLTTTSASTSSSARTEALGSMSSSRQQSSTPNSENDVSSFTPRLRMSMPMPKRMPRRWESDDDEQGGQGNNSGNDDMGLDTGSFDEDEEDVAGESSDSDYYTTVKTRKRQRVDYAEFD